MRYLMGQDSQHPFYSGANVNTIRLNRETPLGLFSSCHANKYIVTEDFGKKIAIVLEHDSIPQFNWRVLGKVSLDWVNWQGPFWLSGTNAALHQGPPMSAGTIEVGDGFAGLDCIGRSGKLSSINLGYAGRRGSDFCEYDGWAIHSLIADSPFFVKSPAGYNLRESQRLE